MAPIIWSRLAGGGRIGMVRSRVFCHNLGCKPIVVKSAFSTQEIVADNCQLQFVAMDHFQNRKLYTRETLGLEKLQLHQSYITKFYEDNKDDYVDRLMKYVEHNQVDNLVQDDLINLIGLADNVKHLDLIEKMIHIFASNQKFFSSGWGTAIMRLYYIMNQVDRANKNLRNDATYGQLFNKKSCYRICMTMLFNAGKYQDVVDIYYIACRNLEPTERNRSPQHPGLSILAFAAYAKLNTLDSLQGAQRLYEQVDMNHFSSYLRMRVLSFLVHLYNNQGQHTAALQLISNSPFKGYVTIRELKTLALIKLKRYEDVICHILQSLDILERGSKLVLKDIHEELRANLASINDDEVCQRMKDTLTELKQNGLIAEVTLESLLYTGIHNQKVAEQLNHNYQGATNQVASRQRRLRLKAQQARSS